MKKKLLKLLIACIVCVIMFYITLFAIRGLFYWFIEFANCSYYNFVRLVSIIVTTFFLETLLLYSVCKSYEKKAKKQLKEKVESVNEESTPKNNAEV